MMKTLLWLDDYRNPLEDDWLNFSPIPHPFKTVWVKRYREFTRWIEKNGLPDAICFDHDLENFIVEKSGLKEYTGFDCAKWLVEYCMDNNVPLPEWNVQSANPAGKENINKLLENYKNEYKKSKL